jgi:hypothetical protein
MNANNILFSCGKPGTCLIQSYLTALLVVIPHSENLAGRLILAFPFWQQLCGG